MSEGISEFKNSNKLTQWVKYFLYAQVIIAFVSIVSGVMEYQLLTDYKNGVYFDREQAVADGEVNDRRQMIIGIIYIVNYVLSGILILRWIYRANENSRQLGAKDMEFTPGWSIGFYFIPIMALFKPYQAMKEIWQTSHSIDTWQKSPVSPMLYIWWFVWLLNGFVGQVIFRFDGDGIDEIMELNLITQFSNVLDIVLAAVTFYIVLKIHNAQSAQADKLVYQ
ncbi:DUF4328 domain-containing protein [Alteromonas sp. KUL49]|uniref:DUF4328 domain-containing protein n=1 Tax=Alteromonas sp. KUL49 TaxID=2480798 RepID=UPI00102EE1DA|nr:DUF4328 domain-containing protein [Alteromonas sp. KUL49]TAP33808.1 DUF4328 domain-containing protein [Alteromonas sp. KUL49]GEA13671.1 hypothetical protein KUL49_40460 [Alteromonas sp. KUL49]